MAIAIAFVFNINAQTMEKKKMVAYFSATGTTESVAIKLSEVLGADLYKIAPSVPYSAADLDWRNKESRSSKEMANKSFRPEIDKATKLDNLDKYDEIFVGFPIWWYVAPTIVNTFLESYNLSGKKIILFATSGGSGFGKTADELKASAPNTTIIQWKLFNGNPSKEQIAKDLQNFIY